MSAAVTHNLHILDINQTRSRSRIITSIVSESGGKRGGGDVGESVRGGGETLGNQEPVMQL